MIYFIKHLPQPIALDKLIIICYYLAMKNYALLLLAAGIFCLAVGFGSAENDFTFPAPALVDNGIRTATITPSGTTEGLWCVESLFQPDNGENPALFVITETGKIQYDLDDDYCALIGQMPDGGLTIDAAINHGEQGYEVVGIYILRKDQ